MTQKLRDVLRELKSISEHTGKVLDRLSTISERISAKSSSTLFGLFGGLFGMTLGYITAPFLSFASLPVLGVLFTSLGIVAGVLIHRGRRRFILEQKIEENQLVANEILQRIKSLPKDAPKEVREELWFAYRSLVSGFHSQTIKILEGWKGKDREPPRFLLSGKPEEPKDDS